jgi:hypothetical protein
MRFSGAYSSSEAVFRFVKESMEPEPWDVLLGMVLSMCNCESYGNIVMHVDCHSMTDDLFFSVAYFGSVPETPPSSQPEGVCRNDTL